MVAKARTQPKRKAAKVPVIDDENTSEEKDFSPSEGSLYELKGASSEEELEDGFDEDFDDDELVPELKMSKKSKSASVINYADSDIDRMIASGELQMIMPPSSTHPSNSWKAGLRIVCFQNGEPLKNWYRCKWCGHNWYCVLKNGTGNMNQHVMRHWNTPIQIKPEQMAHALARAAAFALEHNYAPDYDTFRNHLPIKKKGEKKLVWYECL